MKSNAELLIANWLFLKGIAYQYEAKYEHDVATVQHRQYQPDFFLPEYHVYIEHFGVDRDGRTAPGIDAEKYRAVRLWKQEVHKQYNTRLVTTYTWELESAQAFLKKLERNPAQIAKSLTAATDRGSPAVEVLSAKNGESNDDMLGRALAEISADARRASDPTGTTKSECPTVLVLGRYRRSLPTNQRQIEQAYASLSFRWMTVHAAKGAEADYVVVVGATAGEYGFPSEISDDPLLGLVLSTPDPYPHAEERRVFYVALSRARRLCVVLTHSAKRSEFVRELQAPAFRRWVSAADRRLHTTS